MKDLRTENLQQVIALLTELLPLHPISEPTHATNSDTVEMLTIKECTALAPGMSEYTVRKAANNGSVTSIRTGEGKNGKILINKQSFIDYLNGKIIIHFGQK